MGNKGTIMTNSTGQGKMIRVEEADDGTGMEVGSLYNVVDDAASQEAKEFWLHSFTVNNSGEIEVSANSHWRARGTIVWDDASSQYGMQITWNNDTIAVCNQVYLATSCNDQGDRTPVPISSAPEGTRFRFSYDTGNGTIDSGSLDYSNPDPLDPPYGNFQQCPES